MKRLKGNLKKEYICIYTNKQKFLEYYQGISIPEFIDLPKVVYNEWRYWKMFYNKRMNGTFDKHFQEFKDFWQYNTPETQHIFREMELLSNKLLEEWRIKYTFKAAHEYESYKSYKSDDYLLKTKAQLWEEFKTIWDLDPEDYSEQLLNEYLNFINAIVCDSEDYFQEYPRNFWEFRENANYHSFDSYSLLKKNKICQEWESYIDKNT